MEPQKDGLAVELEVEAKFEESTPNKESSNSLEIDPSLILRWTFFAFNLFTCSGMNCKQM